MKFFEDIKNKNLSMEQVSSINEIYIKLLMKSYDIDLKFIDICAEDEVLSIADNIKTGMDAKSAFVEFIDSVNIDSEKKQMLIDSIN